LAFFNYLVAVLFAFIPIAAYFAYKKGKGILSKGTPIIIVCISILCAVIVVAATFYIQLAREVAEFISLSDFIALVFHPEILPLLKAQFFQALLFTGLGFLFSWRFISGNNKEKLAKVKSLHGNLEDEKTNTEEEKSL
jgi:hypothetical protein